MDETKGGRRPMLGDKSTLTSAPFNSCAWDNAPFSKTDSGFLLFLPALSDSSIEESYGSYYPLSIGYLFKRMQITEIHFQCSAS